MTGWSLVPGWYVLNPGVLVPHIRPKSGPHTWALFPYAKGYLTGLLPQDAQRPQALCRGLPSFCFQNAHTQKLRHPAMQMKLLLRREGSGVQAELQWRQRAFQS